MGKGDWLWKLKLHGHHDRDTAEKLGARGDLLVVPGNDKTVEECYRKVGPQLKAVSPSLFGK